MTQVTRKTIPFAGRVANRDRNAPCPCDSGKKYKKCCGDPALTQARWREEQEQREQAIKERAQKELAELAEAAKRAKEWQERVTMSGVPFLRHPTLMFSTTNRAVGGLSRW